MTTTKLEDGTTITPFSNGVTLRYKDYCGDTRIRHFHVRRGYVYEGDRQVCRALDRLGDTLEATTDSLPHVIIREWKRRQRKIAEQEKNNIREWERWQRSRS